MTDPTDTRVQRFADGVLWCAVIVNVISVAHSLWHGAYAIAGLSAIVPPTLLGFWAARRRLTVILQTKQATAVAQLRKAEIEMQMAMWLRDELEQAVQRGYFRFSLFGQDDEMKPQ